MQGVKVLFVILGGKTTSAMALGPTFTTQTPLRVGHQKLRPEKGSMMHSNTGCSGHLIHSCGVNDHRGDFKVSLLSRCAFPAAFLTTALGYPKRTKIQTSKTLNQMHFLPLQSHSFQLMIILVSFVSPILSCLILFGHAIQLHQLLSIHFWIFL